MNMMCGISRMSWLPLSKVLVCVRMSFSSVGSIKGAVGFAYEDFVLFYSLIGEKGYE